MKHIAMFLLAFSLCGTAGAEELKNLYGFTGEPVKDPCGIDWKDWWGADGPVAYCVAGKDLAKATKEQKAEAHKQAREMAKTIDAQQAAYKKAKAAGDWDACVKLTAWTWVEARMLKSKAYEAIVEFRAARTQEGVETDFTYNDVKDLYLAARKRVDKARAVACATRSATKEWVVKRMASTDAEIDKELNTLDCLVGKVKCN